MTKPTADETEFPDMVIEPEFVVLTAYTYHAESIALIHRGGALSTTSKFMCTMYLDGQRRIIPTPQLPLSLN